MSCEFGIVGEVDVAVCVEASEEFVSLVVEMALCWEAHGGSCCTLSVAFSASLAGGDGGTAIRIGFAVEI